MASIVAKIPILCVCLLQLAHNIADEVGCRSAVHTRHLLPAVLSQRSLPFCLSSLVGLRTQCVRNWVSSVKLLVLFYLPCIENSDCMLYRQVFVLLSILRMFTVTFTVTLFILARTNFYILSKSVRRKLHVREVRGHSSIDLSYQPT